MTNEIRTLRASEIECRVAMLDKNKPARWASLLLYKDARVDYNLLDEVYGAENWQCDYKEIKGNLYCTLRVWSDTRQEWISKTNVGTESNTEAVKGEASDAFKRAAVTAGIGRELYTAPDIFVNLGGDDMKNGRLSTSFHVKEIEYDEDRRIIRLILVDNRNRVRYTYGVAQQSVPVHQTSPTTGDADKDKQLSEAIKQVKSAPDLGALKKIYAAWTDLQGDSQFLAALTARKTELKEVTA